MSLIPGDQLGPYRVVNLIGKGGMGEVYRATDARLNRDVALKVSAKAFDERFAREARAVASLNHPNICTLYDVGSNYLVMELVEGDHPKGPLPTDEALHIANQIAAALEAAHEKGIVHRDLKPGNVLIKSDGTVKVLDFGLAKMHVREQASGEDSPTMSIAATHAGMILGTAAYMAPEQAKGKPVDSRADIWAFGVVLYELTTGRRLFQGEDVTEIMASVVKEQPDLSAAPLRLQPLLKSCLQKDPRKRLQAIGDMDLLLAAGAHTAAPRVGRKTLGAWLAAGVAAGVLLTLGAVRFRPSPPAVEAVNLTLGLPEGARPRSLSLSPDGRRLALTLSTERGTFLYVRPLDSWDLQLLPGTANAGAPFWSPDGRSIGFFSDGSLRVVSAAGGPVQTLCGSTGIGLGGTWNQNGLILFGSRDGQLRQVSAGGGPCTPVNKVDPAVHRFGPAFLPDGNHFLYLRRTHAESVSWGIYLATLDEPEGRKLLPDASSAIYAPPSATRDHAALLFIRDGSLFAQPFDSSALEIAGDPYPLADGASFSSTDLLVAASVSANGTLVYLAENSQQTILSWFDRSGKPLGTVGPRAKHRGLAVSPDGNRAVVSRVETGAPALWLYDLLRGGENLLIPAQPAYTIPAIWEPGGDQMTVSLFGGEPPWIYRKDLRTARLESVEDPMSTRERIPSDWSRDGRTLIFTEWDPKTQSDIWYAPVESGKLGREAIRLLGSSAEESQGCLSPDNRWLAYFSSESGKGEVYIRSFPSGTDSWKVSENTGYQPRWSPGGEELYFLQRTQKGATALMAAAISWQPPLNPRIGPARMLFETPLFAVGVSLNSWAYAPHPDGKRVLVNAVVDSTPPKLNIMTNWRDRKGSETAAR